MKIIDKQIRTICLTIIFPEFTYLFSLRLFIPSQFIYVFM